jgi:predicted transposase YdaD
MVRGFEAMLDPKLKETRIYREVKTEKQAEMLVVIVPILLKIGMTIEQIAEQLKVDMDAVCQTAQENG